MSLPIPVQVVMVAGYLLGYAVWALVYRRYLDPRLRDALGRWLGVDIGWRLSDEDWFTKTWVTPTWGWDAGPKASILLNGVVSLANLAAIVLFGVGPAALFLLAFLLLRIFDPLVGYVALFPLLALAVTFFRPGRGRSGPGACRSGGP